jgi:hypothetical protein
MPARWYDPKCWSEYYKNDSIADFVKAHSDGSGGSSKAPLLALLLFLLLLFFYSSSSSSFHNIEILAGATSLCNK